MPETPLDSLGPDTVNRTSRRRFLAMATAVGGIIGGAGLLSDSLTNTKDKTTESEADAGGGDGAGGKDSKENGSIEEC